MFVAGAAILGGGLVMASAVAAAASLWGETGVTTRLTLLIAVLSAAVIAAEFLAPRLQTVGRVLVHLAPSLVLPVAITATSQFGHTWRMCMLIGGLVGTAAVWGYGVVRKAPLLIGAMSIGVAVAAVGGAALTATPVAIVLAMSAFVFALFGSDRRTAALVAMSVSVQLAGVPAELGFGPGTLRDIGAVGAGVNAAAVFAGLLGAVTLAWRSTRSGQWWLLPAAGASAISALVALFSVVTVPVDAWLILPGIAMCTLEAMLASSRARAGWVAPLRVQLRSLRSPLSRARAGWVAPLRVQLRSLRSPLSRARAGWVAPLRAQAPPADSDAMPIANFKKTLRSAMRPGSVVPDALQFCLAVLGAWMIAGLGWSTGAGIAAGCFITAGLLGASFRFRRTARDKQSDLAGLLGPCAMVSGAMVWLQVWAPATLLVASFVAGAVALIERRRNWFVNTAAGATTGLVVILTDLVHNGPLNSIVTASGLAIVGMAAYGWSAFATETKSDMNDVLCRLLRVCGLVALAGSVVVAGEWSVAIGAGAFLMLAGWHRSDRVAWSLGAVLAVGGGFGACVEYPSLDGAVGLILLCLMIAEVAARSLQPAKPETQLVGLQAGSPVIPPARVVPWFLPSLCLGTLYLVLTTFGSTSGRVGAIALIGVALIGLGAIREHTVAVWCGAILAVATLLAAFGGQLRTLPVWIWVMLGGAALICTAAAVELKRRNCNQR